MEGFAGEICGHLLADLLVAAGGDDDDLRAGLDAFGQSFVGGGVAGMERDDDVGARAVVIGNTALHEVEAGEGVVLGDAVAEGDHVGAVLDAHHLRGAAHGGGEVVVEGEGEVAFAAAHVGHP